MSTESTDDNQRKRVALVYSGQPRHLKECHPNHKATFYEANPNWDIDVFGHIWYCDEWSKPDSEDVHLTQNLSKRSQAKVLRLQQRKGGIRFAPDTKDFIQEQYQPKKIVFEKPRYFQTDKAIDNLKRTDNKSKPLHPNRVSNMLSMMYSIEEANNLKRAYEKEHQFTYDCVVRIRTDNYFEFPFGCPLDVSPIKPLDEYDLTKLNLQWQDYWKRAGVPSFSIDDSFLFANSEIMDKCCNLFSSIDNCPDELMWYSHAVAGHHVLISQKIPIESHHWLSFLMRKRGKVELYSSDSAIQYFYQLRKQTIEQIAGKEEAKKHERAIRWLCEMPGQKISIKEISDLTSFYKASGLLLETDGRHEGWYYKNRIRAKPASVTYSFGKRLKKDIRAYVLKQQLIGWARKIKLIMMRTMS